MKYISYAFASLMTLAMLLLFINLGQWAGMAAQLPFMKVAPWLSGGQVVDSASCGNTRIYIHETVHPGLFEDENREMVQIDILGPCCDSLLASIIGDTTGAAIKTSAKNGKTIMRIYRSKSSACYLEHLLDVGAGNGDRIGASAHNYLVTRCAVAIYRDNVDGIHEIGPMAAPYLGKRPQLLLNG